MSHRTATGRLMHRPDSESQRVATVELFFDLVYVLAVTQLSHQLVEHLNLRGALETAVLLLAVWQAWIHTTWFASWFDPRRDAVRGMLILIMLLSLVISAAIPDAFGERGLAFAGAYVAISLLRNAFAIANSRQDRALRRNYQRMFVWATCGGVLWMVGALLDGDARLVVWLAALAVDYAGPVAYFATPRLGRSTVEDWSTVSGLHMAERCQLFMIVALGESVLVTGATVSDLPFDVRTSTAALAAFLCTVGLWWVYFDKAAEDAGERIAESEEAGRIARSAYTYFHIPMVAGIIVTAVGDELVIAHPSGQSDTIVTATILGGPGLFLFGHAFFKFSAFGVVSVSRLVALGLLGVVAAASGALSPLGLTVASTVVIAVVGVWDRFAHRETPEGIEVATPAG